MSGHEWAAQYESAMLTFQRHIYRTDKGTFGLDADDGKSIGINDPVIFADLKRSLNETNRKIERGELDINHISSL